MPDLKSMLAQAAQVQSKLKQMQDDLEKLVVSASSGGGMVTVTADGKGQVRTIKIDPSVVTADVEMLEDLVLAAVSEAQRKAATAAQEEMQKATGGLNLPFKLPF